MKKAKRFINFFSLTGKLKETPRKGITLYGVKNPDSSAEHIFRVAIMVLLLNKKNINTKRALKIALVHDLPKIYTGDITPYDCINSKKEKKYELAKRWPPRCSINKKKKLSSEKTEKEKEALMKVVSNLPEKIKEEIISLRKEYVGKTTNEGRFVFQLGKLENLLEAYECWKKDNSFPTTPWWKHAEEVIDDPDLLRLGKEIEKRELKKKPNNSKISNIFDFLIKIGELKEMPRRGWVMNEIENPETIADHTFRASFMAWILGKEKELNVERIIKIALTHDLCEVYAGDTTPYDTLLPKSKKELRELMKTWPRFSKKEKQKQANNKFEKEKKSLKKLTKNLPTEVNKEINSLWIDYEKGLSPEGVFFKQTDKLETLLQSSEYWKKYKKPPQKPWWEWAKELFDDPLLLDLTEEIDRKFH